MRVWVTLTLVLLTAGSASAQSAAQDPRPVSRPSPDFLFERPQGTFGIRGSWVLGRNGSDWYDFVSDQLTVGFDYGQQTTHSEYRRYVDNNRLPIEQQTLLRSANLGGGLKFALTERGRDVGRLAWVPRKLVPYVGAGAGAMWYQLRQSGDFVDYVDLSVFPDVFESEGWTPSVHVMGGVDVRVLRRAYVSFDARYLWASGDLGRDWIDFDPIDLSGLRLSAGINFIISEMR